MSWETLSVPAMHELHNKHLMGLITLTVTPFVMDCVYKKRVWSFPGVICIVLGTEDSYPLHIPIIYAMTQLWQNWWLGHADKQDLEVIDWCTCCNWNGLYTSEVGNDNCGSAWHIYVKGLIGNSNGLSPFPYAAISSTNADFKPITRQAKFESAMKMFLEHNTF